MNGFLITFDQLSAELIFIFIFGFFSLYIQVKTSAYVSLAQDRLHSEY